MGLFDKESSEKGEVRIGVSEEKDSRLKTDVEEKMADKSRSSGSDVSLEDLHSQNEKIIQLLQRLLDENSSSRGSDRSSSSDSHRVTDRDDSDGGGMDGIL